MDRPVSRARTDQVASFLLAETSIQSLDASLGYSTWFFHQSASSISVSLFTLPPILDVGKVGARRAPHAVTVVRLTLSRLPVFSAVSRPEAVRTATYASFCSRVSSARMWYADSARLMNPWKTCGLYRMMTCLPEPFFLSSNSFV